MDKEQLDEIEKNFINNPAIDKSSVQAVLQQCVDEIRRLTGDYTIVTPGTRIIITGNTNAHEFEINQECIVVAWDDFSEEEDGELGVEAVAIGGNEHWLVRHTDYDVI